MMDFLDPKKRKAYNIRLFIGFVLVGIVLILGTTILALITAGYNINRHTGQVIQNGLVFVNAQPQSASIYINGSKYGTTNARIELASGNYDVDLKRAGYQDWNLAFNLMGGSVEQLTYPFLFPTNPIKTSVLQLSTAPQVASESPNQHWLVVNVPNQIDEFSLIDVTNPKTPITTLTLPAGVLNIGPGTNNLQAVEWSTDNKHLLLKHTWNGGFEYIMLDINNPLNSFNVNAIFPNVSFDNVTLFNKTYNSVYLFDSSTGTISLGDEVTKTVTPVLSDVLQYDPYKSSEILYVSKDLTNANQVDVKLYNNGQSYLIRTLPISTTYILNMASYNSTDYVIVGCSSLHDVYVYQDPLSEISGTQNQLPVPYTLLITNGYPQSATFSNTAQFIAAQSGSEFAVYDFSEQTHYRFNTGLPLSPNELANWMDGDRLTLVSNSILTIFDFDGTNTVRLTGAVVNFKPAFNSAYDAVYTVSQNSSGQYEILRTSLIANQP